MSASSAQKYNFKENISWERCLTIIYMAQRANIGAYAAEGTHLIWRSPLLSTQQQGLLPFYSTENSAAQALMFWHLPENSVLQRRFSSTRTVPILPTPKKGTDTLPGVQILLPLFSVLASESDILLVHSRTNIYPTTKSMD